MYIKGYILPKVCTLYTTYIQTHISAIYCSMQMHGAVKSTQCPLSIGNNLLFYKTLFIMISYTIPRAGKKQCIFFFFFCFRVDLFGLFYTEKCAFLLSYSQKTVLPHNSKKLLLHSEVRHGNFYPEGYNLHELFRWVTEKSGLEWKLLHNIDRDM